MRQYVGARYVPKVYTNSLDPTSCDWESGVTYEPLTIVDYNSSSYISRIPVPGSVGNPPANPTYWAVAGAYNGQIANLQNQIDAIKAELSSINEMNLIVISDSYGTLYPDATGETFTEEMAKTIPNLTAFPYSGDGFLCTAGRGTFRSNFMTDTASWTQEQREAVDVILVAAGRNDYSFAYNAILTEIGAFVSDCKTRFPHATVKLAFIANGDNSGAGTRADQFTVYKAYAACGSVGGVFIDGAENILKTPGCMAYDYIHPNATGRKLLGDYLVQGLLNGSCDVRIDHVAVSIPTPANVTLVEHVATKIDMYMENGTTNIYSGVIGVAVFDYNTKSLSSGFNTITLGNTPNTSIVRYPVESIVIDLGFIPYDTWTDSEHKSPISVGAVKGSLYITTSGEIQLYLYSGANISNLAELYLPGYNISVPGVYC